ncbi:MAG: LysR substrate-binding domain-containing protein, partial [Candidatus Thiodiazotropha taylori]|nr:LysR substrate-binding domain-containing protein [Candidatus Thiodiazotropha taylori]
MPSSGSSLRRNLEIWFQRQQIEPVVVAEFEDRALMKTFGERGTGVFTTPTAVEQDVIDKYRVEVVGRSDEITESFYVISPERHIKHPAINTITQTAKNDLFN